MAIVLRLLGLLALLLATPFAAEGQSAGSVDPVSGLPIPVLPGQFVLKTQTGCLVIADAPFDYMTNYRWDGPCRLGVVQDVGVWRWDNKFVVDRHENGYRPWAEGGENGVDLRRTATQDWEHLAILARDVRDPEFDRPRGTFHDKKMVEYKTVRNGHFIQKTMLFRRTSCAIADETGYRAKDLASFVMRRFNFTRSEAQRIASYCKDSLKRLYGDNFDELPFGFFYHAAVHDIDQVILPQNGGEIATEYVGQRHSRLCPDLTSPYNCEATWQPMLAEFVAQYDRMKAEEPERTAQARKEMQERFAPLRAAWAKKAVALAGRQ